MIIAETSRRLDVHIQTYVAQKLQLPSYFAELELLGTFNDTRERDFSRISPVIENMFFYNYILIRYETATN